MLLQRTYGHNGARENTRVFSNADETRFTALNPVKDAGITVCMIENDGEDDEVPLDDPDFI